MAKIKVSAKKLPDYPADHKLGMVVPKGGSDCAKCSFWDGKDCENKYYRQWNNGSGNIPSSPETYCCDFSPLPIKTDKHGSNTSKATPY